MDTEVLVVGAGPTGLLLAAELRRREVECLLIDALDAPREWDRATVVHPRSLELFESLGIVEPFLATGARQRQAWIHADGELLGEIDLSLCGSRYPFNVGISEEATESILGEYLAAQGGAVRRAEMLVDLAQDEGGVTATIEHGGERQQLRAAWAVGCDGLGSVVRKRAGIELRGHDIAEPWAVFDVTLDGWDAAYEGNFGYLDQPLVILTALPGRRWRVYTRPTGPDADLVADAAAVIARYQPQARMTGIGEAVRFICHSLVADTYRAGRVLIAGDAAHVCSPFEGHGMNTGLQDSFNLAWKLALVCRGTAAPSLLDSYGAERRPVAQGVADSGDEVEASAAISGAEALAARDAALRAAFADPDSSHHEAIAEAELNISYAGSPVVAGGGEGPLAAGERLPDLGPVQPQGAPECRLHELAHGRSQHLLLVLGGEAAERDGLLAELAEPLAGSELLEDAVALGDLSAEDAVELGVDGLTLLAIRPDGHLGLRAEHGHPAALRAYLALF
jgi:2-polyprenyl-6-methoxyphenol hydroxylase-like FAD-dependent oxidoreductase